MSQTNRPCTLQVLPTLPSQCTVLTVQCTDWTGSTFSPDTRLMVYSVTPRIDREGIHPWLDGIRKARLMSSTTHSPSLLKMVKMPIIL